MKQFKVGDLVQIADRAPKYFTAYPRHEGFGLIVGVPPNSLAQMKYPCVIVLWSGRPDTRYALVASLERFDTQSGTNEV
jgi:hypothetical protein